MYIVNMIKRRTRLLVRLLLGISIVICLAVGIKTNVYHNELMTTIDNLQEINNAVTTLLINKNKTITKLQNQNTELLLENKQLSAQYDEVINTDVREYLGKFTLTYYCISGTTASGNPTIENVTVAVDPTVIPLDTPLYIDGLGVRIAHDTGGAIKGNKIDVYVRDYDTAIQNGKTVDVDVWMIK